MFVVIEGIDRIGKTTLSRNLQQIAVKSGLLSYRRSFPNYQGTAYGQMIKMYLDGYFGELHDIDANFINLLYASDRYLSKNHLLNQLKKYDLLICDRYVASNLAYSSAKLLLQDNHSEEKIEKLIQRNIEIEHKIMELPVPDIYILLDADYSQSPIFNKENKDMHESNIQYISYVRQIYQKLAKIQFTTRWKTLDLIENNQFLSVNEIADRAWQIIYQLLYIKE